MCCAVQPWYSPNAFVLVLILRVFKWRFLSYFQNQPSPLGRNMATQPTPPSVLREFCPLYYLLNAIPAKVLNHSNSPKPPNPSFTVRKAKERQQIFLSKKMDLDGVDVLT